MSILSDLSDFPGIVRQVEGRQALIWLHAGQSRTLIHRRINGSILMRCAVMVAEGNQRPGPRGVDPWATPIGSS